MSIQVNALPNDQYCWTINHQTLSVSRDTVPEYLINKAGLKNL